MIKILDMQKIAADEVLARTIPMSTVEDQVTEIIANVRANGDNALLLTAKNLTKRN